MADPQKTVISLIGGGFRQTFWLNTGAVMLIYVLAFASATGVHLLQNSWSRVGYDFLTSLFISMPVFLLAPLLILIFGLYWDFLPVAFLDEPRGYILPILALSLRPAASLSRLIDQSLEQIRHEDYMRTAMAKGLRRWQVILNHGLKNSLAPVLAQSSFLIVSVLSGSFMVEVLFAQQGLGQIFVEGLTQHDVTVVVALSFFYSAGLILVSFIFDLLQKWADPRLKEVL